MLGLGKREKLPGAGDEDGMAGVVCGVRVKFCTYIQQTQPSTALPIPEEAETIRTANGDRGIPGKKASQSSRYRFIVLVKS